MKLVSNYLNNIKLDDIKKNFGVNSAIFAAILLGCIFVAIGVSSASEQNEYSCEYSHSGTGTLQYNCNILSEEQCHLPPNYGVEWCPQQESAWIQYENDMKDYIRKFNTGRKPVHGVI